MKLYSAPLSGHSHRARLFLSLIGVAFETVDIDLATRQQKTPAGEIARGPAAARLITVFKAPLPAEETINRAHAVLSLVEAELGRSAFIVGNEPTIADVALYSYISSAPEGNVDLSNYPRIKEWLVSIEALPGFIPFQKTKVGLAA